MKHWRSYFSNLGITATSVESNPNALSLTGLAGAPVFRAVETRAELDALHTSARSKSNDIGQLLILGLPFTNPGSVATMPGDIVMPRCRVYAGHVATTFSLTGHRVENAFSKAVKLEVSRIIAEGPKTKTPLCDWLLSVVGSSWPYGKPSSKEQLDSLIALAAKDPNTIGHIRARQLSFGRGCADALLLPTKSVTLPNNDLNQQVKQADYRFISLEEEMAQISPARHRIYSVMSHAFLSALAEHDPASAQELGCNSLVGSSALGQFKQDAVEVDTQTMRQKQLDRLNQKTNQTNQTK